MSPPDETPMTLTLPDERAAARSSHEERLDRLTGLLFGLIGATLLVHLGFLFMLDHDVWDGTLLDYWLATNDFRGVEIWYREANGFITLWLLKAIHLSDWITALVYNANLLKVAALLTYPAGAFMIYRFVGASRHERLLATLVLIVSPILLLNSSIMNSLIMIYVAFCWIGLALLERGRMSSLLALILIVISCQLWSNYAMVAAFVTWRVLQERRIKPEFIAAAVISSATIYLLLFHFELSGRYAEYNSLTDLSIWSLAQKFVASTFTDAFWPVYLIYVVATALSGLVSRRFVASHWLGVAGVAIFYVVASMPYIMVGKQPPSLGLLFDLSGIGEFRISNNYGYRHLIPAYGWICFALAATVFRVQDIGSALLPERRLIVGALTGIAGLVLVSSNLVNLVRSADHIRQRDAETVGLVTQLQSSCVDDTRVCVVDLSATPHYLADAPRPYELNYLYFKAFGRLGLVERNDKPGQAQAFAEKYGCSSPAHAVNYLIPFSACTPAR